MIFVQVVKNIFKIVIVLVKNLAVLQETIIKIGSLFSGNGVVPQQAELALRLLLGDVLNG